MHARARQVGVLDGRFSEHVLRDMLTIFARAQPSDEVCRRAPGGFPEAFMRFALAARSGHTFDVGDRLRLGLQPVPVRTAAIAAVIVRGAQRGGSQRGGSLAKLGLCAFAPPVLALAKNVMQL